MSLYKSNSRRKLEMMLNICLNILTLALLCELGHAYGDDLAPVIALRGSECLQTCQTQNCRDEASRLINLIDNRIDPCDNFYEFACGTFIQNTSPDAGDVSIMSNAQVDLSTKTVTLAADVDDTEIRAFSKIKKFLKNCLDETLVEQAGRRPLLELLNNIGGWPVVYGNRWNERGYNWVNVFDRIKQPKMMDYYFPASIIIEADNYNNIKNAIKIHSVKLNVGPNFFTAGQDNTFLKAYLNNMINLAVTLGARNNSVTLGEMQKVLDFEVKLYKLITPPEKLEFAVEEKISIADLTRKCPGIPWEEFLNNVLRSVNIRVDQTEHVYVNDMAFICGVAELTRNTPKRVIANYLAWRIAKASLPYMSQEFLDIENQYKSVVEGQQQPNSNAKSSMCINEVMELFTVGISTMFVRKYYDQSTSQPIVELFSNLKSTLRKSLQQNEWMDERTRRAALEKIDMMNVTVGFAEELLDNTKVDNYYRTLEVNEGLYLDTVFNVTNFLRIQNYKSLRQPSSHDRWTTKQSSAILNAYHVFEQNNVEIPAGIITVFYKKDVPQYVNYGSLGTIVGHEVMHGFDNTGKIFDKHGNQVNWWQPNTEKKFKEKARCLIDQYSNFTVPQINMKVNGELTQGENIADNGGFRAAYLAYNEWAKRNNIVEKCLPSLNYTPQQMFWISAATVWCSKISSETLRDAMTDVHSPDRARIITTFSNINEFAKDFNCPVGSRMNPEKKCTMW